jgi:hypothetical protein
MVDEDDSSIGELEVEGVFPVHRVKEGEIVEVVDRSLILQLRKDFDQKFFDMVKKGFDEGLTVEQMKKKWISEGEKQRIEAENIIDSFKHRRFAKIIVFKDDDNEVMMKLKYLKPEEYKDMIPKIAERLADKLSKEDLVNLMMDVLMDEKVDKVKRISDKLDKANVKVQSKSGCFKILVDDDVLEVR